MYNFFMEDYTKESEESLPPAVEEIVAPVAAEEAVEVKKPVARKKYADPVVVDLDAVIATLPEPAGPYVVGDGATDSVYVSAIIYKNLKARRSLSVYHLQRRLFELGYEIAAKDKRGYFGDNTLRAVKLYQENNKLEANGQITFGLLNKIFAGDPNVEVHSN